jgi:rhodanese-related sulfurtransferase
MDRIEVTELQRWIAERRSFTLLDVRREAARAATGADIPGSTWMRPEDLFTWKDTVPTDRPAIVYCAHGHELSQGVAATLRAMGIDARSVVDGFDAWRDARLPVAAHSGSATLWVTRERPKVDRIACPWLIRRFVDPRAQFLYVPADQVLATAQSTGATPFDVPGVELTHRGELCSFDAILAKYRLDDPALQKLAPIVRAADTDRLELAPQAAGLLAISLGLVENYKDDHALLAQGMVVYDALYAWCRSAQPERHGWNYTS